VGGMCPCVEECFSAPPLVAFRTSNLSLSLFTHNISLVLCVCVCVCVSLHVGMSRGVGDLRSVSRHLVALANHAWFKELQDCSCQASRLLRCRCGGCCGGRGQFDWCSSSFWIASRLFSRHFSTVAHCKVFLPLLVLFFFCLQFVSIPASAVTCAKAPAPTAPPSSSSAGFVPIRFKEYVPPAHDKSSDCASSPAALVACDEAATSKEPVLESEAESSAVVVVPDRSSINEKGEQADEGTEIKTAQRAAALSEKGKQEEMDAESEHGGAIEGNDPRCDRYAWRYSRSSVSPSFCSCSSLLFLSFCFVVVLWMLCLFLLGFFFFFFFFFFFCLSHVRALHDEPAHQRVLFFVISSQRTRILQRRGERAREERERR
jgi:hypothetical protein